MCVYMCKLADCSQGWSDGSFAVTIHQGVGECATPFSWIATLILDFYLIMLSVMQGSIKYHFLSL